jgi:CheY-like chemotaxis protein
LSSGLKTSPPSTFLTDPPAVTPFRRGTELAGWTVMLPSQPVHVVAVFSYQPTAVDFLKGVLDSGGFATFAAPPGLADLNAFLEAIQPHAVVVDMAASTETQWHQLLRVRSQEPFRDIPLVVTTGDVSELKDLMSPRPMTFAPIVQMCARRGDDLRELRAAVHAAIHAGRSAQATRSRLVS